MRQRRHVAIGTVPEYLRRNELVVRAYGTHAGLQAIEDRIIEQKRSPKWLLAAVQDLRRRLWPTCKELAAHRDELQAAVKTVADAINRGEP